MSLKIWSMLHSQEKRLYIQWLDYTCSVSLHCKPRQAEVGLTMWDYPNHCTQSFQRECHGREAATEMRATLQWLAFGSYSYSSHSSVVLCAFSCAYLQPSLLLVQVSMCGLHPCSHQWGSQSHWVIVFLVSIFNSQETSVICRRVQCMVTGMAPKQTKLSIQTVLHK